MSRSSARRIQMIATWLFACAPAMAHSIIATRGKAVVYPDRVEFTLTMTVPQMAHVYGGDAIDTSDPDTAAIAAAAQQYLETVEQSLRIITAQSERLTPSASEVSLIGDGAEREAEARLTFPLKSPPTVLALKLSKPVDAMSAHKWQLALAARGNGDADWRTARLPSPSGVEILDLTQDDAGMHLGPTAIEDIDPCTLDKRRLKQIGLRIPVAIIDCAGRDIVVTFYAAPLYTTQYWQPRPAGAKALSAAIKQSGIDNDVRNLSRALTMFAGPEPLQTEPLTPTSQKVEFMDLEGRLFDGDNPLDAALTAGTARIVVTSRYELPESARFVQARWWDSPFAYTTGLARIAAGAKCLSHHFNLMGDNYGWFVEP